MSEIISEKGRPVIKTKESLFFNKYAPNEALEKSGSDILKGSDIQLHRNHGPEHYQQNFWVPGVKDSSVKTKSYIEK